MPVVIQATTNSIAGLQDLWAETCGESEVCVAVLDGLVDQSHSSFLGAKLTQLDPLVPNISNQGSAAKHGTHVSSMPTYSASPI